MYALRKPHNMREVKEFNYQVYVLLAAYPAETHIDQAMLRVKLIRYERIISDNRIIKICGFKKTVQTRKAEAGFNRSGLICF